MNRKDLYFLLLAPLGKPAHRFSLQAGFSIIEVMMSLVLLAITAALALPSYQEMVQKRQLTHGAEQIMAFVNTAQGEAAKRNEVLWVSYTRTGDADWCIGAAVGAAACDCKATPASCSIGAVPWIINSTLVGGTELIKSMSGAGDNKYRFDPIRGIACAVDAAGDCVADSDALMEVEMRSSAESYRLKLTVSRTGQVLLCSDDTAHGVPGYPPCTQPVVVAQSGSV